MKSMKLRPYILFVLLLVVPMGCADLAVENTNEPDRQKAITQPSDLVSLLGGTTSSVVQMTVEVYAVHVDAMADQTTTTNAYFNFWDFAEQPRLRLNNSPSYSSASVFTSPWSSWNRGISTANTLIAIIENDGTIIEVDGVDVTANVLAGAYFLRGLAEGYIGMTYDQGYVVTPDTDLTTLEYSSYTDVILAAVADMDKAIEIANGAPASFSYSAIAGTANSWNKNEFKDIANSYAAKFLANWARTLAEANDPAHWALVESYANKGIGGSAASSTLTNFIVTSVGPNVLVHNYADWTGFVLSDNAGYLPSDQKIAHLLDPENQPVDYPAADGVVLDPVVSDDARAYYQNYTTTFGFLRADRNRALFTNYWNWRMWAGNNWWEDGYPIPMITGVEMDYIRAEAKVFQGDGAGAAAIMNNTPAGNVAMDLSPFELPQVTLGNDVTENLFLTGGTTFTGSESLADWQWNFLKEYSMELDMMGGYGLQWYMMRRHDLLQPGTALQFAVPGAELGYYGIPQYSFGGAGNESEVGTADGSNSWKNLYSKTSATTSSVNGEVETFAPKMVMPSVVPNTQNEAKIDQ